LWLAKSDVSKDHHKATVPKDGLLELTYYFLIYYVRVYRLLNMYIIEQALAMFSRRNTAVGQPSLERPPPAGDDVALSLVSRFAPRS
jgi:hypothetical protein